LPNLARTASKASRSVTAGSEYLSTMGQHDGIGQAVGGVVPAAELVRDGMHVTDIRAREGQPGIGGGQGHSLARHEIGAVAE
jgi:hypothetical protein